MRKTLLIALLLFILTGKGFSQETLVPYRVGDKYGLSDYNGKLIVQPIYDWIEIGPKYPAGYFGFTKGDKKGILYNKKELITAGKNYDFNVVENKFILSKYKEEFDYNKTYGSSEERNEARRNPKQFISLYNLAGQSIYKDNFAKLSILDTMGRSVKHNKNAKYTLFVSTNFDGKFSVFEFDNDKQIISKWFLKDYEKFSLQRGSSIIMRMDDAEFIAKKDWSADEQLITFEVVNNLVKMNSKVIPKKGNSADDMLTNSISGDLRGDPTADIVISEGGRIEPSKALKIKKYFTRFKLVDGKISFIKNDIYQKETVKDFILPAGATNPKIENLYFSLPKNKDSVEFQTSNVLTFQVDEKFGVYLLDSVYLKPIYTKINAIILNEGNDRSLSFLVGLKDDKSTRVRYGTVDIYGRPIIPIVYDEIVIDNKYSSFNRFTNDLYATNLRVTTNGKMGKISAKNKIELEPIYDEIADNNLNYMFGDSDFQKLRIGKMFGLYSRNKKMFVPAIFDKQIGFMMPNYQNKKDFNLLGLVNEDGTIFCYARKDGFKYYKAN
ncbi:MAG: hypothetical protein EOO91_17185 [Pedobacter sp.]|nr:MAG: hypothetical protein EOO91_17185 [Pedobacter sp.]